MVARDDTEIIKWRKTGAERGNAVAQFNLGVAYLKGDGVDKDYVEAYKWLHLSAAGGYDEAPEICDALEKKMDVADVTKAQRLANNWKVAFEKSKP